MDPGQHSAQKDRALTPPEQLSAREAKAARARQSTAALMALSQANVLEEQAQQQMFQTSKQRAPARRGTLTPEARKWQERRDAEERSARSHAKAELIPLAPLGDGARGAAATVELDDLPSDVDVNRMLRKVKFFRLMDDAGLVALRARGSIKRVPRYATIIREGVQGLHFYVLLRGRITCTSSAGMVNVSLTEGAYFGEGALVAEVRRQATVVADEDCILHQWSAEDVRGESGESGESGGAQSGERRRTAQPYACSLSRVRCVCARLSMRVRGRSGPGRAAVPHLPRAPLAHPSRPSPVAAGEGPRQPRARLREATHCLSDPAQHLLFRLPQRDRDRPPGAHSAGDALQQAEAEGWHGRWARILLGAHPAGVRRHTGHRSRATATHGASLTCAMAHTGASLGCATLCWPRRARSRTIAHDRAKAFPPRGTRAAGGLSGGRTPQLAEPHPGPHPNPRRVSRARARVGPGRCARASP
eukprot:3806341-Prymnesium_polylepis.1